MYNLLVADDEVIICRGVESMLMRLENPYIGKIYKAYSGTEALFLAKHHEIHILITDIAMPEMTGLQLMDAIKEIHPEIFCIALSGFDQFEYVSSAFKKGALEYLLKPVKIEQLRTVLDLTINEISERAKAQSLQREYEFKLRQLLAENSLNRLQEKDAAKGIETLKGIFPHPLFCLTRILFDHNALSVYNTDVSSVLDAHASKLAQAAIVMHYMEEQPGRIIFLFNLIQEEQYHLIHEYLERISLGLSKDILQFAALTECGRGLKAIEGLYRQLQTLAAYRFINGRVKVLEYCSLQETEPDSTPYASEVAQIRKDIKLRQWVRAAEEVDRLFKKERFINTHPSVIQQIYYMIEHTLQGEEAAGGLVVLPDGGFEQHNSFEDIREHFYKKMLHDSEEISQNPQTVINIALDYIHRHYSSQDLSLAQVAKEVSMNYSYFSTLFKEKLG